MPKRSKEDFLARLRDQAEFLLSSARAFYGGNFAESLRIATALRVLVHETAQSKSLIQRVRSNGLDLSILEHVGETPAGEEAFTFAVGIRVDPGTAVFPSVDLQSTHFKQCSVGAWWNQRVFSFWSSGRNTLSKWMVYTRKRVVLILANKEGGAHVDPMIDPAYAELLTQETLGFELEGVAVDMPDLAKFLTAQSGVEMLECLKRNFLPDLDVPVKWDVGTVPPVSITLDQIAAVGVAIFGPSVPRPKIQITKR